MHGLDEGKADKHHRTFDRKTIHNWVEAPVFGLLRSIFYLSGWLSSDPILSGSPSRSTQM